MHIAKIWIFSVVEMGLRLKSTGILLRYSMHVVI